MKIEKFKSLIFNDDEIDNELVDVLIKAGSHEYIKNSAMEVPDSELSDVEFSEELDQKLRKYFSDTNKETRKEKLKSFTSKTKNISLRIAAVLLVLLVLAAGFIVTSEATQIKLINLYLEQTEISTDFSSSTSNILGPLESIIGYIPERYEMVYETTDKSSDIIHYETLDGGFLQIEVYEGVSLTINSEGAITYMMEIGDISCYVAEHEEYIIVVYSVGNYVFNIYGTVPLSEIEKIIENINY